MRNLLCVCFNVCPSIPSHLFLNFSLRTGKFNFFPPFPYTTILSEVTPLIVCVLVVFSFWLSGRYAKRKIKEKIDINSIVRESKGKVTKEELRKFEELCDWLYKVPKYIGMIFIFSVLLFSVIIFHLPFDFIPCEITIGGLLVVIFWTGGFYYYKARYENFVWREVLKRLREENEKVY